MNRAKHILIALDQLANTLLGGWPDETLSSRAWRWHIHGRRSWPRKWIDKVFALFGDRDHCETSWRNEIDRKHITRSMRGTFP